MKKNDIKTIRDLKLYRSNLEFSIKCQEYSMMKKLSSVGDEIHYSVYVKLQETTQKILQKIFVNWFVGKKKKKKKN